ncbi:MAG: Flagella basal body rod protein, partial [Gammaproteobacteria bacterium]|nr:Flagella basal body rod protein [Gammaproteobacteria bacterium]
MFENVFGIHEQALLLHGQRVGVLATNLANADTPNYKAR